MQSFPCATQAPHLGVSVSHLIYSPISTNNPPWKRTFRARQETHARANGFPIFSQLRYSPSRVWGASDGLQTYSIDHVLRGGQLGKIYPDDALIDARMITRKLGSSFPIQLFPRHLGTPTSSTVIKLSDGKGTGDRIISPQVSHDRRTINEVTARGTQ